MSTTSRSTIIASSRSSAVSHELASPRPQKPSGRSPAANKTGNPTAGRPHAKMCDSPKIKTSTPTKKKPEEERRGEKGAAPDAVSAKAQRRRNHPVAPGLRAVRQVKDSPEKEPKSKKQKRQSEKLKCISSPKPIGI